MRKRPVSLGHAEFTIEHGETRYRASQSIDHCFFERADTRDGIRQMLTGHLLDRLFQRRETVFKRCVLGHGLFYYGGIHNANWALHITLMSQNPRIPVHGWLVLDKPAGLTSTQALGKAR